MLEIETRETGGTSSARAVRRTGKIPGVLYGNGREALPFEVESRHLREALSEAGGRHAVLEVKVPGAKTPVHAIIKAMQLHPLRDTLQHVDLLEVRMDRRPCPSSSWARPRASRPTAASSRRTRTS
jgi:large subunit ribosomal protein L25